MANEPELTIYGNLTDDPVLRFTGQGVAVASFTVASTPRSYDKQANEWKDGETLFLTCSVWAGFAENVAESLRKGMRVLVTGRLKARKWEKDGQPRTSFELDVEEVGPSLRFATAEVRKAAGSNTGRGSGTTANRVSGQRSTGRPPQGAPIEDPWAEQGRGRPTPVPAGSDPWGAESDVPPF